MKQGFISIQASGKGLTKNNYSYCIWAEDYEGQDTIRAFIVSKKDWNKIDKELKPSGNVLQDPKKLLGRTPLVSWTEELEQTIKETDGYIIGHLN